jgi:hypothetical protein
MKKIFIFKEYYLLYISFFLLGFGNSAFYLPFFAVYYFCKLPNILNIKIGGGFLVLLFLMLLSVFPLFTVGLANLTPENPEQIFIGILFSIIFAGFAIQYQSKEVKYFLILFYIFGMGLNASIIVVYSFIVDPLVYGYGRLLIPYTDLEINSPGISNTLSIPAAVLLYLIFSQKKMYAQVFLFMMLVMTISFALFTGGRTFFVIVLVALSYLFLMNVKVKFIINLLLYGVVFVFITSLVYGEYDEFKKYVDFTMLRFDDGLASNRFSHYAYGIGEIIYYPIGGFSVDQTIEKTYWFHNIILDNARIAGWFPAAALVSVFIMILMSAFQAREPYFKFFYLVAIVSIIVMMQEVVIEGNYKLLILMYLSGIALVSNNWYSLKINIFKYGP